MLNHGLVVAPLLFIIALLALFRTQAAGSADFLAAQLKHRIRFGRPDRLFVDVPTEECAIERDGAFLVGCRQLGPAE